MDALAPKIGDSSGGWTTAARRFDVAVVGGEPDSEAVVQEQQVKEHGQVGLPPPLTDLGRTWPCIPRALSFHAVHDLCPPCPRLTRRARACGREVGQARVATPQPLGEGGVDSVAKLGKVRLRPVGGLAFRGTGRAPLLPPMCGRSATSRHSARPGRAGRRPFASSRRSRPFASSRRSRRCASASAPEVRTPEGGRRRGRRSRPANLRARQAGCRGRRARVRRTHLPAPSDRGCRRREDVVDALGQHLPATLFVGEREQGDGDAARLVVAPASLILAVAQHLRSP